MNPGVDLTVVAADERSTDDSPEVAVDVARWERLAVAVLLDDGAAGELTLTFIDASEMAELNAEHMGKARPDRCALVPDGRRSGAGGACVDR